jgi:hypothetical protein
VLDHGRKRRDPATRAQLAQPFRMTERPKTAAQSPRAAAPVGSAAGKSQAPQGQEKGREREKGRAVAESVVDLPGTAHDSAGIGEEKRER